MTNVSIVRYKRNGFRYEIACYNNKVVEWRLGNEKDLDNVLQIPQVYSNVSKGTVCNKEELRKGFDTDKIADIVAIILDKGELQVGEKERQHIAQELFKDMVGIIVSKTVNPETGVPYTIGIIEKALKEIHYSVHPTRNAKQQALDAISKIQASGIIPLERALMKVQVANATPETLELIKNVDSIYTGYNFKWQYNWVC